MTVPGHPLFFVEDQKLNFCNIFDQLIFQFANDPIQSGLWPGVLYRSHNWQGMRYIADRRKA